MNYEKEITALNNKGYVLLRASRTTNAPIGWKRNGTKRWGYTEEMQDTTLAVYKSTFNASILAKSHNGFYLGHNDLCCIDLDTKKLDAPSLADDLARGIIAKLGKKVAVERTKSNGYHIYFRYPERLDNVPDWTNKAKDNWIELYYSKRFIACYLSNSKRYKLEHGTILYLEHLTFGEHKNLLNLLKPFKGKKPSPKNTPTKQPKQSDIDKETWEQAESYVKQLEQSGQDITGDNPTWFKIGKGFASAFGEKGFDMFNRLSQFSATYNEDTIAETYARFVQDDNKPRAKKVSIATFFKMCNDAGLADLRTLQIKPKDSPKEFELFISKKDSMAEKCHTVVTELLKHIELCCIDGASFYMFDVTHWKQFNSRYVIEFINYFVSRSTVDSKYIKPLQTVPYLEMMLKELRMITLRDSMDPKMSDDNGNIFINTENGILHVDTITGKRIPLDHNSAYNFTTMLPYGYDPIAKCPKFDEWLDTQVPNKDMQTAYYAFVASCLTKHKTDVIMILAGETMTGKSSLIDITRRIIGVDNCASISAGTLFSGKDIAAAQVIQMENKLLAYDFDAQPFTSLDLLLKMAAQEPVQGWKMHKDRRDVSNYARIMVAMNPFNYSVYNSAVARRLITISMDVPVAKDNTVMPAIYNNELAGIFNKVLNIGLRHLIENVGQIKVTTEMRKATLDLHTKNKDTIRWFEEKYIVLKQSKDSSTKVSLLKKLELVNKDVQIKFTSITEMYSEFRTWAEDVEGYAPTRIIQRKYFIKDMKDIGLEDYLIRQKEEVKRGLYVGIKVVTNEL